MKKFTFLCIASLITTIMWSQVYVDEDFSGGALPSGWANNDLQGNGQTWEFDNPGGRTGNMPINAPFAIIDSDNYGSGGIQDAALETIAFDVSAASAVQLDFDYYYRTFFGSTIAVEVFDGTSWVEVYGIEEPSSADPAHMTLDITAALNGAANAQVRFHYVGEWAYYWMIDNVTIQNVTCLQPTALTEDAVTTTTADVSWTAGDAETAWNVSWGAPGYTPDTDDLGTDIANTTSFQITGLSAQTDYEFYIQADCGNGDESLWAGPLNFTTACDAIANLPYTDNMDTYGTGSDAFPNCWLRPLINNGFPSIVSGNASSAPNSLKFQSEVGTPTYAVSPALADDIQTLQVSFMLKREGTSSGTIDIGVMSDPLDTNTFELVQTIAPANNNYAFYEFNLDNVVLSGGNNYIALRHNSNSDFWYYWMDDFMVQPIPSCLPTTALLVDAVTATTADISWTAGDAETAWNVSWGAPGYTPDTDDLGTDIANTTSFQITNLTASTDYEFYIQADCGNGDESAWTGPVGFSTLCGVVSDFNEDFEATSGTSLPNCWSKIGATGSTDTRASTKISGSRVLYVYNNVTVSLPVVNNANAGTHQMVMDVVANFTAGATIELGYLTDATDASSFVSLSSIVTTNTPQEFATIPSGMPVGDVVFAIYAPGTLSSLIDNVRWEAIPSCLSPTALTEDAVTKTTADVSWTAGDAETAWNVSWGISGYTPGDGDLGTDVASATSYQITGLSAGTNYDVYVQANCGGDLSTWTGPIAINTLIVNDNLCDALPITLGATSAGDAYTNIGATQQTDEPNGSCWSGTSSPNTVWFSFVAPTSGNVTVTTDITGGTLTDTHIAIYEAATDCADLTTLGIEVGCDEDGGDIVDSGWTSVAAMTGLTAGATYYIQVDGYGSNTGTFGIEVQDDGYDGYVYTGGVWSPSDPSVDAGPTDNIFVMDGSTTLTSDLEVNDVTVMSGATLNVGSVLTINGDITNDGNLVFISTANGNGELALVPVTSTITGQVTVQRSMSAKRSYRMVSSSVTTTTSIHDNWQEGATSNTDNPNPGYGTHITGSTTDQMNGFDGTLTGNASMFMVNASTQAFEAVGDTDVNVLTAGEGYLMYVRGSRAVDLTADPVSQADETVLRATGNLFTGTNTQNFATTNAGEFVMFGNPYQSTVDLNAVIADSQNLNGNFAYYYDPNLGVYGGYVTVTLPAGTNTSNSQANEYLQPGQAVQLATASNGPTSIIFNESAKAPGNLNSTFSNESLNAGQIIIGQLFTAENHANNESLHDSFQLLFNSSYSNELNNNDAVKPFNFTENIGIGSVESAYSVERRALPEVGEEISLFVNNYAHENYMLRLEVNELEGVKVYLNDNYTEESVLLESGENLYGFSVNELSLESISSNRFSLSFERVTLGLDQPEADFGIEIYPNPTEIGDAFYITTGDFKGKDVEVRMIDMYGKTVYNTKLSLDDTRVKIQPQAVLSSGVYMVSIINKDKKVEKRLIIM